MAKKMYYTEQEVAEKLGLASIEELDRYVREHKLRVFQDGAKKMYQATEIDALTGLAGGAEEIELAPGEEPERDAVSLTAADQLAEPGKEDTVITAEGISIFDDEDLEIEAADPMAKTQIAPPLEDQLSSDSVSSGSGLLDLTRESDDTSLGEVLDHIDMVGAIGSSLGAEAVTEPEDLEASAEVPLPEPTFLEEIDPSAGLFGGAVIGACLVMLVLGGVVLAAMTGVVPGYLKAMQENLIIVLLVAVVVVGASAVAGFLVGRAAAAGQMAMQQAGAEA